MTLTRFCALIVTSFLLGLPSAAETSPLCPGENGSRYVNFATDDSRKDEVGGFVSNGAYAGDYVFIAKTAAVCGSATVDDRARILGNSVVKDNAVVDGNTRLIGNVIVGGDAHVTGESTVRGWARLNDGFHDGVSVNQRDLPADEVARRAALAEEADRQAAIEALEAKRQIKLDELTPQTMRTDQEVARWCKTLGPVYGNSFGEMREDVADRIRQGENFFRSIEVAILYRHDCNSEAFTPSADRHDRAHYVCRNYPSELSCYYAVFDTKHREEDATFCSATRRYIDISTVAGRKQSARNKYQQYCQ